MSEQGGEARSDTSIPRAAASPGSDAAPSPPVLCSYCGKSVEGKVVIVAHVGCCRHNATVETIPEYESVHDHIDRLNLWRISDPLALEGYCYAAIYSAPEKLLKDARKKPNVIMALVGRVAKDEPRVDVEGLTPIMQRCWAEWCVDHPEEAK